MLIDTRRLSRVDPVDRQSAFPVDWLGMAGARLWESTNAARQPGFPMGSLRGGLLRQTEEREQVGRVEKRVEGDDPTVRDFDDLQRPRLVAAPRTARPVLPE